MLWDWKTSVLSNNVLLSLNRYSPLADEFTQMFPGHDLPSMLAKFSLPVSLAEFRNPLEAPAQEVDYWINDVEYMHEIFKKRENFKTIPIIFELIFILFIF